MNQQNQAFIFHFRVQTDLGMNKKGLFEKPNTNHNSIVIKEEIKEEIKNGKSESEFLKIKDELVQFINNEIDKPHFAYYLKSIINKWKNVEKEIEIVDNVINWICDRYNITRTILFKEKSTSEQRAILYYTINKKVNLNYSDIADAFNKHPSVINRAIRQLEFRLENQPRLYSEITNFIKEIENRLLNIK